MQIYDDLLGLRTWKYIGLLLKVNLEWLMKNSG